MRNLIILFLFAQQCVAQNNFKWAESGTIWHHSNYSFLGQSYLKSTYEFDTLISSQNCQKISNQGQYRIQTAPGVFQVSAIEHLAPYYLYKSNDSIFIYRFSSFHLAFKTNATVGEVWDLGIFDTTTNEHGYVRVDSVFYETYNGISLRNIKINACDINGLPIDINTTDSIYTPVIGIEYLNNVVNEKFGPLNGFNGLNMALLYLPVNEFMPSTMICFQSDSFPLFKTNPNTDCFNNIFTGLNSIGLENAIELFPNPINDVFTLKNASPNSSILVFDAQLKIVQTLHINKSIEQVNIGHLQSGLYFVQVQNQGGENVYTQKVLKL